MIRSKMSTGAIDFVDPLFAVVAGLGMTAVGGQQWFSGIKDGEIPKGEATWFEIVVILYGLSTLVLSWLWYHKALDRFPNLLATRPGMAKFVLDDDQMGPQPPSGVLRQCRSLLLLLRVGLDEHAGSQGSQETDHRACLVGGPVLLRRCRLLDLARRLGLLWHLGLGGLGGYRPVLRGAGLLSVLHVPAIQVGIAVRGGHDHRDREKGRGRRACRAEWDRRGITRISPCAAPAVQPPSRLSPRPRGPARGPDSGRVVQGLSGCVPDAQTDRRGSRNTKTGRIGSSPAARRCRAVARMPGVARREYGWQRP